MRVKQTSDFWRLSFISTVMTFSFVIFSNSTCNAAVYLDGAASGCSNGSTNYNPAARSCGSGSDKIYVDLASFSTNIAPAATNFMRAGSYSRTTGDYRVGALNIDPNKAGTASSPTIIKAYPGEEQQVLIATAANKFQYNPNPGDTSGAGSSGYYPNPSIMCRASYITIDGVKSYGQVVFDDVIGGAIIHDSGIQNSDMGGGGGYYQGPVVYLASGYNFFIKNNKIHHSCWGESNENGAAVMGYDFSVSVQYNTFYDNWYYDFRNKDTSGNGSRTTELSYNLFLPSTIFPGNSAISGIGNAGPTDNELAQFLVHNNIIIGKGNGVIVQRPPTGQFIVYNNMFINCGIDIFGPTLAYYNNVFYHSSSGQSFWDTYGGVTGVQANYNVYYSTGTTSWLKSDSAIASDLTSWKSYSGLDAASISANPNFVNAGGKTAADFKRSSYAENFTGSPYSTKAGAYVTGNETIGFTAGTASPGSILAPRNLIVK